MAKRKRRQAGVPATTARSAIPVPDPRSIVTSLDAIVIGAAHSAADEALFQAQDLMYEAFDAQGARRVALAREALAISPDCADAYLLLAEETASSAEEAQELLTQGVAAGERALGAGRALPLGRSDRGRDEGGRRVRVEGEGRRARAGSNRAGRAGARIADA